MGTKNSRSCPGVARIRGEHLDPADGDPETDHQQAGEDPDKDGKHEKERSSRLGANLCTSAGLGR